MSKICYARYGGVQNIVNENGHLMTQPMTMQMQILIFFVMCRFYWVCCHFHGVGISPQLD
jgi:hypothetical protein